MRKFINQYWAGSGNESKKQSNKLKALLREGLYILSGIQQDKDDDSYIKMKEACNNGGKIDEIGRDLFWALVGKEIIKTGRKLY